MTHPNAEILGELVLPVSIDQALQLSRTDLLGGEERRRKPEETGKASENDPTASQPTKAHRLGSDNPFRGHGDSDPAREVVSTAYWREGNRRDSISLRSLYIVDKIAYGEAPLPASDPNTLGRRTVTTHDWPGISNATLSDRVYQAIRDNIVKGRPPAGEFVREVDVSTALGVSRTPVREALARLARDGFVEKIPRRGFRVPEESLDRLLELYPIVSALEVLAGESAFPRIGPEGIAQLRGINLECIHAAERKEVRATIEANHHFHHVLSEQCGNARLCDLLDELRAQMVRLEIWSATHPAHNAEAVSQHEEILLAIERRDYPQALGILKTNRLQTYSAFTQELPQRTAKGTRSSRG